MRLIPFSSIALSLFFAAGITIAACEDAASEADSAMPVGEELQQVASDYIATYQARDDWQGFLSFYSDSLYFLDINLKTEFFDREGFASFYDWPNPGFKKVAPDQPTFVVEDLVVANQTAIIKGRFQPFYWQGELQEWTDLFTIWLHFDDDLKIVRQYDFIKYPKAFLPD